MPGRRLHNKIAKLFGIDEKLADEVNKLTDIASKFAGPRHREIWGHSKTDPILFSILFGDWRAGMANLIHQKLDELESRKETRKLIKLLELIG